MHLYMYNGYFGDYISVNYNTTEGQKNKINFIELVFLKTCQNIECIARGKLQFVSSVQQNNSRLYKMHGKCSKVSMHSCSIYGYSVVDSFECSLEYTPTSV